MRSGPSCLPIARRIYLSFLSLDSGERTGIPLFSRFGMSGMFAGSFTWIQNINGSSSCFPVYVVIEGSLPEYLTSARLEGSFLDDLHCLRIILLIHGMWFIWIFSDRSGTKILSFDISTPGASQSNTEGLAGSFFLGGINF